jgi:hypothetical protein
MTQEDFDQWLTQHRVTPYPVRPAVDARRLPSTLTSALQQLAREHQTPRLSTPLPSPILPPLLP